MRVIMKAAALAAMGLCAGQAEAATIVQNVSYNSYSGGHYAAQFDPNLGTLTEVDLSATLTLALQFSVSDISPGAGPVLVTEYASGGLSVGTLFVGSNSFSGSTSCRPNGLCFTMVSMSDADSQTGGDLSLFIGHGTVGTYASGRLESYTVDPTTASAGPAYAAQGNSFGGAGTLTYVFEPRDVPEPATWAMMIAGFGLVGAAARRRTSQFSQAV